MVLRSYSIGCDGSSEEFNLSDTEVAFLNCEFLASFADAFEDCSDVLDELFRCAGGNSNIVYVLGTLVCFNDGVELPPHEARKC